MVVIAKTSNKLTRIREFHIDYVGHAHLLRATNAYLEIMARRKTLLAPFWRAKQIVTHQQNLEVAEARLQARLDHDVNVRDMIAAVPLEALARARADIDVVDTVAA